MKKIRFLALTLASVLIISNSSVAYAAPQTMADGAIFDAEYYAAQNPDVVAALGTDADTLYAHYSLFGKNEGRLPYDGAAILPVERSNVSESLAQVRYNLFYNPYIVGSFVYDAAVLFDADYYLANYPELAAAVGTDYKSLFNHYINIGRFEGRSARIGFYPERGNYDKFEAEFYIATSYLDYENGKLQAIDWLSSAVNDSMSERELVTFIHDEICNRAVYDYNHHECFRDFETFKNGTARYVCQQYSDCFEFMSNAVGIETQEVSSYSMNHAWNRVKIDGIWYDIDVTWDDYLSNKEYFLVPAGTGVFADRTISRITTYDSLIY